MVATSDESIPPEMATNASRDSVLDDVVARPEDQSLVDLLDRGKQRLDAWFFASLTQARFADLDLGQGAGARTTAWVEQAPTERGAHVDVDDQQVFLELLGARDEVTALVEQHRRAVEDQFVLPADEVDVEDRHRRVGRARREHRVALVDAARVVRRGVDVDDELGASRGLRGDRPVRDSTRPRRW